MNQDAKKRFTWAAQAALISATSLLSGLAIAQDQAATTPDPNPM